MKKATNPFGIFDYVVTGSNEEVESAAAHALEEKLEAMSRLAALGPYPYLSDDIADARRSVAQAYGVTIGSDV